MSNTSTELRTPAAPIDIDELKAELTVNGRAARPRNVGALVGAAPKRRGKPTIGEVRARKLAAHFSIFTRVEAQALLAAYYDAEEGIEPGGVSL